MADALFTFPPMKSFPFILLILFFGSLAEAQNPPQTQTQSQTQSQPAVPGTDIYLLDFQMSGGVPKIGQPVNITNHRGYDNQPFFLQDRPVLLFTSIRNGDQADIYEYNWETKETKQRTDTPESEFSPTPLTDGFSVVRVEKDQTQRLWKFPLDGDAPSLLLENVKPVGYHTWIDSDRLILFVLGEPPTLQLASIRTGKAEILEKNIGRSLHKIPGTNHASFIHKVTETDWRIVAVNPESHEIKEIARTLPGSEDYVWIGEGTMLMAKDSQIYLWRRGSDWKDIANLQPHGISSITRLAVSPSKDRIAIVAVEK